MRVFAYIDRSQFAESVCRYAVWVANQLHVGIELIHCLDQRTLSAVSDYSGYLWINGPDSVVEERMHLDEAQNRLQIQEGRALLNAAVERVLDAGVTDVTQRLHQGSVPEHLEAHAADTTLVVVGKRGEGARRDPQHLGSNIERLIRSGSKPILIVSNEFSRIETATLAWDGGRSSGEAIHFLANNPLLDGIETTLFHVADRAQVPMGLSDAQAHLAGAGVQVHVETQDGPATETILKHTSDDRSQLLIIGAYGHSRIRQMIVGSTTTELLLRATTPLLVFH